LHFALVPRSPLAPQLKGIPKDNIVSLPLRNALDAASALELARLISRKQIEIVHVHMARDYPLAAYATRRNRSSRLIITRHVLFPLSRLHGVTLSNVARVIAVSEAVAARLREQQLFAPDKIVTIHNGIDVERFAANRLKFNRDEFRRRLNLPANGYLAGTVGEINPLKGHEDFVKAAALIADRFPDLHFIIAGEDSTAGKEHLKALETLIKDLGLEQRVHRFGWLDDIGELYCALNLFVSTSHSESFGLAIAEAMACGTPVIASATDGAKEIISDGVSGLLVPIGDTDATAHAMAALLDDEKRRNTLAAAGRASVRERFSLDEMVDKTEQIYREAMTAG
jgi:L-malate glycosyltransferase